MKNLYLKLLTFLLLISSCTNKTTLNANDNYSIDSLNVYLKSAGNYNLKQWEKEQNNKKALEVLIEQPNDSLNRVNFFKVANRYYNMNRLDDYKQTVNLVLKRAIESNDSVLIPKAYVYLGDYYHKLSIPDSAFIFYNKSEKIYSLRNEFTQLAQVGLNKASVQFYEGDFFGSERNVFRALNSVKNIKNNIIIYDSFNLLGVLYNEQGEYDKSLEFHNKAFNIIDNTIPEEFQSKATSLNNIGNVLLNLKDYKRAKNYFNEALKQDNLKLQKTSLYAMALDNLGYAKFKLKEKEDLPEIFYNSLKIRDSLNLPTSIIASKIHLSEYYVANHDSVTGIRFLKEAWETAKSSKNAREVLVALKQLSLLEPEKASIYSKDYIRINDSLQKAERKMGDKFTRIEYETEQVIDENQALSMQNRTLFYVFSILCLLGLFFFIFKSQQVKNRELLFKQQQQIANEDIYNLMIQQQNQIEESRFKEKKRVAQELHDGVLSRMFGLRMSLDSLNRLSDEAAAKQRTTYLQELKTIEQDIREISHDLNKEKAELISNFIVILDKLFEDQKRNFKTTLHTNIDRAIKWELIGNVQKINIYRIIQEALQNCNKYASATKINIVLKKSERSLILLISDNGIGFNVKQTKKGIGLQNIAYRTKECLGNFDIKSDSKGTILEIIFPLQIDNDKLEDKNI